MQVPSFRDRDHPREQVPMTPMIDVVFLLLIFFVCASAGQVREFLLGTELSAGDVQSEQPVPKQPPLLGQLWLHLRRTAQGHTLVEFNDPTYGQTFDDFQQLQERLKELAAVAPELPVILDIDPDVPMDDMIAVYDACRLANFETVKFATRQPTDDGN